jgi:hypothetical protein
MTAKGRRGRPGESADGRCGDRIDDRWAVPVAEAMRAMQILVAEGRALVGAEYWMRFGNRYQPTHEAWAFRPRRDGEAWSGYVAESLFAAARGIEFREHEWAGRDCLLMITAAPESSTTLASPARAARAYGPPPAAATIEAPPVEWDAETASADAATILSVTAGLARLLLGVGG